MDRFVSPRQQPHRRRLARWLLLILVLLLAAGCAAPGAAPPAAATSTLPAAVARATATRIAPAERVTEVRPAARARATPANAAAPRPATAKPPPAGPTSRPTAGVVLATPRPGDRMPTVSYGKLPPEALTTLALIASSGPFPYRQDGVVFQNRESLLPRQRDGYYHEYTVVTPGSPDRGARRIIAGGPGEFYYTSDHYASFLRVVP